MKKYTLFILMSLMTLNAFSLTQEEKDKIYEAIVAEAKMPQTYVLSPRSDIIYPRGMIPISNITDIDIEDHKKIPSFINMHKDEAKANEARSYLNSLPPSKLLPAFYELRLDGKIRDSVDYYAYIDLDETNEYDKADLVRVFENEAIVRKKRELAGIVLRYSRCEGFIKGDLIGMINPKASYESNFRAYLWLEGRRFMPEIWNVWYPCWQNEMSRKKPRESVTEQLVEDIGCFGTFLFPHLNEAIKEGDYTLTPVLEKITYDTDIELPPAKEFCEWYSTNSYKYDYPPCEGIRKTIEKVKDPYILSELKGEDTYDDRKKYGDKWAFHSFERNVFKQVLWQAEDYYNKREYPPDYWYYKLPDEADYEYPSEIPSFSGSTNFNKGFLKKIEEKRK